MQAIVKAITSLEIFILDQDWAAAEETLKNILAQVSDESLTLPRDTRNKIQKIQLLIQSAHMGAMDAKNFVNTLIHLKSHLEFYISDGTKGSVEKPSHIFRKF